MQAQAYIFLIAGFDTTTTTLVFIAYYLALNPDIQSKLQEEIDEYFPTKGKTSIMIPCKNCPTWIWHYVRFPDSLQLLL